LICDGDCVGHSPVGANKGHPRKHARLPRSGWRTTVGRRDTRIEVLLSARNPESNRHDRALPVSGPIRPVALPSQARLNPDWGWPGSCSAGGDTARENHLESARWAAHRSAVPLRVRPVVAPVLEHQRRLGACQLPEVARTDCADRGRLTGASGEFAGSNSGRCDRR
jgi:hypothetical protein